MRRRDFARYLGLSVAGLPFISLDKLTSSIETQDTTIPRPLRKGDTVGLIAPASANTEEQKIRAIKNLNGLGLKVIPGKTLGLKTGFISGTDEERLHDLHTMYRNPEVDAIWCVRGGYGTTRLLPKINYDLIRDNPKALIGYSDITGLHNAIYTKTGIIGFHGPVGGGDMPDYAVENIEKILFRTSSSTVIKPSEERESGEDEPFVFQSGRAHGKIMGGNLSLLTAMCGTEYLPDFKDEIVFLEDIGERTYRIDRMLVQLFQATNIADAAGIILGQFTDCKSSSGDQTLMEVLKMHFEGLSMPVMGGYSIGHIDHQTVMPIGLHAHMDTSDYSVELYF